MIFPDGRFPPLYAIVNFETNKDSLGFLERLYRVGCALVQLRIKGATDAEIQRIAEEAVRIRDRLRAEGTAAYLVLNDFPEIAAQSGTDGVHLGQTDESPRQARQLLGPGALLGLSTHTIEQALQAPTAILDYVALGPVFRSPTKQGHAPETGLELLSQVARAVPRPIVAIGGINHVNVSRVYAAGAVSVAVISDLERTENLALTVAQYHQAASKR
ncbi:MAG: thiamine phosphate synthase [Bdellovibrionales bacterium]|nr:thiamine phosphate synthase [Bdellovibrionales bacterium]